MPNEYALIEGRTEEFLQLDYFQRKSVSFIRDVKTTHGSVKASQIVAAFSDVLGKEWSNKLILDMVAGDVEPLYQNSIRISSFNFESLIPMIKALRSVTNMGLAEARDAVVELKDATHAWRDNQTADLRHEQAPSLTFSFNPNAIYGVGTIDAGYKILREVGFHIHE